jgi:thiol-disulfide isomerase/thioredoxin
MHFYKIRLAAFTLFILFCLTIPAESEVQKIKSPKFKIANLEHKLFKSSKNNNRVIVISFFYTRCTPCFYEMPALLNLAEKKGKRISLLFIDPYVEELGVIESPDDIDGIRRFAKKINVPFRYIYFDAMGRIAKKFSDLGVFHIAKMNNTVIVFPTIVVIDKQGYIIKVYEGSKKGFLEEIQELIF